MTRHTCRFEASSHFLDVSEAERCSPLLQGPVEFLDEPGEWALQPNSGLLYYWPYDPSALRGDSQGPVVVAATSQVAIEFAGENHRYGQLRYSP